MGGESVSNAAPMARTTMPLVNSERMYHPNNACKAKHRAIQIPKYWNWGGSNERRNLNGIARSGMESENTIELPMASPYFVFNPIGNCSKSLCRKKFQPM